MRALHYNILDKGEWSGFIMSCQHSQDSDTLLHVVLHYTGYITKALHGHLIRGPVLVATTGKSKKKASVKRSTNLWFQYGRVNALINRGAGREEEVTH